MGYYGWEQECDLAVECEVCQAHENTIETLKDEATMTGKMVTSIVEMLYSREKLDLVQLEKEIDNLFYHLDIPLVKGYLQIEQKRLPSFLRNLTELNKIA